MLGLRCLLWPLNRAIIALPCAPMRSWHGYGNRRGAQMRHQLCKWERFRMSGRSSSWERGWAREGNEKWRGGRDVASQSSLKWFNFSDEGSTLISFHFINGAWSPPGGGDLGGVFGREENCAPGRMWRRIRNPAMWLTIAPRIHFSMMCENIYIYFY